HVFSFGQECSLPMLTGACNSAGAPTSKLAHMCQSAILDGRTANSSMPIHLEVYHPDRIVVGVARGEVTLAEFGGFVRDLAQAGVMHYRKIIDVTAAKSAAIGKDERLAADAQLRQLSPHRKRGPLALVVDPEGGRLAQSFKALAADDRPVEIFRSLREARAWLGKFPVTM